jgi:predicted ATPase/DNA-binding SARP family transcriptional activator
MDRVATTSTPRVDFRVLGPVEAWREDAPAALGGRQQRWLLGLLLVQPGQTVSSDHLIDELWRGRPPAGAEGTLRVYVSRLRSALGGTALVARPPGYALDIDVERCDAWRFERLVRDAQEALARGAAGLAAERLGVALALWRGPAFADVRDDGVVADEARRLDELRLIALEDRIEADLALGRCSTLAPELERLIVDHPTRERLWRQLVLALHHSDRRVEALAACDRARRILADGLGVDPSNELRVLEGMILRQELSPAPAAVERHNLPASLTSFVGREPELGAVAELLRVHRLVTITGTGGAGKTRLALEASRAQVGAWTGGAWFVDLTSIVDPRTTPGAVADVLGVRERADVAATEGLVEHLRDKEALILLDNCEHVADACAKLVHDVLRACPSVRVVATSRIPLGVPGEAELAIEPLPTPDDGTPVAEIATFASVRLFLDRGRARRRDLATTPAEMRTVGRLCREVDGLPLAIELAAARAKALSVDDMASRLDDRLRFLRSGSPLDPPRHQTLRATIDWSHDLLGADERELLAALSVFAGGFSLGSVAAICTDGSTDRAEVGVMRLVESSLVATATHRGTTRYRLLETIREYAAERLASGTLGEDLRRAHAEHFLAVAREAPTEAGPGKLDALAVLDVERENMAAAMRWTLAAKSELAVPLAAALWRHWLIRGRRRQGLAWLEEALRLPGGVRSSPRAVALAGAALLARLVGDVAAAETHAREGLALGRTVGPPRAVAVSLNVLTTLAARTGDVDRARAHCAASVAIARAAGDERLEALALVILSEGVLHAGRYAEACEVGERALTLARSAGDDEVIALALARLGIGAVHQRRLADASDHLAAALVHAQSLGFPETAAWCCEGLAVVAAEGGDPALAARLLGAGEALRHAGGGVVQPAEAAVRERALAMIHLALSEDQVEAEIESGRCLGLDEVAAEAAATPRAM